MKIKRDNTRKLYIEPCAGLGNRMYAMASALYYFDACGFDKLIIIWKKELPFKADFSELFDFSERNDITILPLWQMSLKYGRWFYKFFSDLYIGRMRKSNIHIELSDFRSADLYDYDKIAAEIGTKEKCYIDAFSAFADEEVISRYIKKIKIRDELKAVAVRNVFDGKHTLGVQIRRTDHEVAIKRSPIELFVKKIDELISGGHFSFIFLSTDDDSVRSELKTRYNEKILDRPRFSESISRITDSGMKDAMVDMLSLSMCDKILISFSSTFGMCAAYLGNCSYEVVDCQEDIQD